MKKIVFLALILSLASGFDIDDYDRGNEARNAGDYATAYEIFYDGCEQKDVLSCEALGDMFVNEEINEQMDGDLKKHSNVELGVYENAKARYDELFEEFKEQEANKTVEEEEPKERAKK